MIVPQLTGRQLEASAFYRRFLDGRFRQFTLAGLLADDEPILLRQIYVPLSLASSAISDHASEAELREQGHSLIEWLSNPVLAKKTVSRNRNVFFVSGEAGSGKTTLARSLVTSLAGTLPDEASRYFENCLPFPILLRDAPIDRLQSLDELIDWWLAEVAQSESGFRPEDIIAFLDEGLGILLLDGLDEVGEVERRSKVLNWLAEHPWIRGSASGRQNTIIVTARPTGFEGVKSGRLFEASTKLHIAPFSLEQIRTFLKRWFELRPLSPMRRSEQVESFIKRLMDEPRMGQLRALARRPAYLTSLAFVHGTRGALPHTRAALYESLIDAYIDTLDRQRGLAIRPWDRQEKKDVLAAVAFHAHSGLKSVEGGGRNERRFVWTRASLEDTVRQSLRQGQTRFRTLSPDDAGELTDYFIARTGLLVEGKEGAYQFGHLSFQEYLTALYVLDRASGSADKTGTLERGLLARLGSPGWLEVALLALAVDSTRTQGTGHRAILARLSPINPAHVDFIGAMLAGEELPLESLERRAWVLAWAGAVAVSGRGVEGGAARQAVNHAGLNDFWSAVREFRGDVVGLRRRLLELVDLCVVSQDVSNGEFDAFMGDVDPLAAPRLWLSGLAILELEQFVVNALALPLFGEFLPPEAEVLLNEYFGAEKLFRQSNTREGIPQPSGPWRLMNRWSSRFDSLERALLDRTPLLWMCVDESTFWASTMLSRWAKFEGRETEVQRWRRNAWLLTLEVEQILHSSILAMLGSESPPQDGIASLLGVVRRLDMCRALALSFTRNLANTPTAKFLPFPPPDLSRDLLQDVAAAFMRRKSIQATGEQLAEVRDVGLKILRAKHGADELDLEALRRVRVWGSSQAKSVLGDAVSLLRRSVVGGDVSMRIWDAAYCYASARVLGLIAGRRKGYAFDELVEMRRRIVSWPRLVNGPPHMESEWAELLESAISPLGVLDAVLASGVQSIRVSERHLSLGLRSVLVACGSSRVGDE